jgi:hypothetical protein
MSGDVKESAMEKVAIKKSLMVTLCTLQIFFVSFFNVLSWVLFGTGFAFPCEARHVFH